MKSFLGSKASKSRTLVGTVPSRRYMLTACLSLIFLYGCNSSATDVTERVKVIIIRQLKVGADRVTENARFVQDLGTDSLDYVVLISAFEEEFGIEIPDDAAEGFLTVGDAVRFIEKARPSN